MSDNIIDFHRPSPTDDPPADRAVAEALGEGAYLGAMAIDGAEGDYLSALADLEDAIRFVRQRHLAAKARRIFGGTSDPDPEAA